MGLSAIKGGDFVLHVNGVFSVVVPTKCWTGYMQRRIGRLVCLFLVLRTRNKLQYTLSLLPESRRSKVPINLEFRLNVPVISPESYGSNHRLPGQEGSQPCT